MDQIKQLRLATDAGIVECKKAWEESQGDLKKAIEILRKKGIAKAAKQLVREANEGLIKTAVSADGQRAYILELNTETDFVARNEKFQNFAKQILSLAQEKQINDLSELLSSPFGVGEGTVKTALDNLSGTVGEKMMIKQLAVLTGQSVAAYTHLGGKIGVLVALDQRQKESLAMDIAMQVAAANPKYLAPAMVPVEEIEAEKAIYRAQLLKENKPAAILDKIIAGKISKYYSEVCLLEQEFIKDEQKKIKDLLGDTKIINFLRFSL